MAKHQIYEGFELGPIRPPSEAYSLLLRVTRGCNWNRCRFCGFYRGETFAIRPVEHICADIDAVKLWIDVLESGDERRPRTAEEHEAHYMAMHWYQSGMESVFLQDANSMVLKPADMIAVLTYLRETFPGVQRVTSYGRSDAIDRRSVEELRQYRDLGLNRLHVGMETGHDPLLALMNKGVTRAVQVSAGQKAMAAGIEVSEFYMPGLGGKEYAEGSARDTALALNEINPDFIRIRSTAVADVLAFYEDYANGTLTRSNDVDDVREIRRFIETLDGITSVVESDHILNVLLELRGKLPEDKGRMLQTIDRFLGMDPAEQRLFRLGRRLGYVSAMDEMDRPGLRAQLQNIMMQNNITEENIDPITAKLMERGIPLPSKA